ncbi:uncharacterized protein A4U43_C04F14440 [Asparagus officinalis]|uniref:Uncharacterized protein n=1 Tax=Asparagus officinalis TaxID=4686 RepID=A0A5P1F2N0_ASPOF|nr:uncharacterized protein A4U43_C04F14440 [Asparagus officinalis]
MERVEDPGVSSYNWSSLIAPLTCVGAEGQQLDQRGGDDLWATVSRDKQVKIPGLGRGSDGQRQVGRGVVCRVSERVGLVTEDSPPFRLLTAPPSPSLSSLAAPEGTPCAGFGRGREVQAARMRGSIAPSRRSLKAFGWGERTG